MGTAKYSKTTWVNGSAPAVSATNLNNIETGIENSNGVGALGNLTSGARNTAVGTSALNAITNSNDCSAFGYYSLKSNTSGSSNTAIGVQSLELNTTGAYNVAVGHKTMINNTTGSNNVAIGYFSMEDNTIGDANTAVGNLTLANNTNGRQNTAVGSSAGRNNLTGNENVFIGNTAGYNAQTGDYNIFIGYDSGYTLTSGNGNIFCGRQAGYYTTTGSKNIAIGKSALFDATTASGIVAIGENTGLGNTLYSTNSTMIGNSSDTKNYFNSSCLGYGSTVTGNNQVQLGDAATTTYVYGTVQNRSDQRDKTDIKSTELGLDFIEKLNPVDFRWDMRDFYNIDEEKDGTKKRNRFHHGFIAQEIKQIIEETGIDFGGFQHHSISGGKDVMTIGYDEFIAPMVKAIQELSFELKRLKSEIELLKSR